MLKALFEDLIDADNTRTKARITLLSLAGTTTQRDDQIKDLIDDFGHRSFKIAKWAAVMGIVID
ncbi:hypothetical protein BDV96DRAFT_581846 [Lophiotrema nucula]|uniref:Uncharacterized protein n=1 Tax=Lophiotrema nucula TaxID=690887 RepID=A0A6A5YYA9_9PLEO|nr:hypothetical protein BDV96DRAFT_581846 [Lophiotrema nucula]